MNFTKALITRENMEQLQHLLYSWKSVRDGDRAHLEMLAEKLECAQVASADTIPPDVVTMNSQVCVREAGDQRVTIYKLVFPGSADLSRGRVSVLAPIGTALLGHRAGTRITWKAPSGKKHLWVVTVLYQPEAARRSEIERASVELPSQAAA